MNARRAKRQHRLAADLQEAGLHPPAKARRLDRWLERYRPTARARSVPPTARVRRHGGRALPPMPQEAWTLPGRGPARVGRPGPTLPKRIRRSHVLEGRRITRQLSRAAWRDRQRRRRDRHQKQREAA